ncbi:MAG: class I SAM-dependent methyltransferase [Pseudonocardiaceae bacterium]
MAGSPTPDNRVLDRIEFGLGEDLPPVPSDDVDDLHARRAASFGSVATEYALHRPDYPDEAVAWALASVPHDGTVLDLGAGTGKLTAAILRCGVPTAAVLAVEPDDGMRAELCRRLPEIAVLRGSAERIPADEGAVDAVLVGQAFHWFDPDRALPEIARVLRPGGVLAAIGNVEDDSVGWVAELAEATQAARPAETIGPGFADMPEHPAFGKPEQRQFRWRWPRTIDSLLETTSTHSWALVSSPQERAAALAAIRRFLEQHPATRDGTFELPMQTLVQQTTRRA